MNKYLVYVRKKDDFAIEADACCKEIRDFLGIDTVERVEIYNRYDSVGMSEATYNKALHTLFSEPQCDDYLTHLPRSEAFTFMSAYLSGQYDQRADSCCQCIKAIDPTAEPIVKTSKVYRIYGTLTPSQKQRIKEHMINPVESEEIPLDAEDLFDTSYPLPTPIPYLENFLTYSKEALQQFREEQGLAMSEEDLIYFQNYFIKENKIPTLTELKVVDTYWSDHCRHTTFLTELTDVEIENGPLAEPIKEAFKTYETLREMLYKDKPKKRSLMDLATIMVKVLKAKNKCKHLVESAEINACTLEVTIPVDEKQEPYLILFKNETHNHPTEIEPFGGAATCLGGAIRDPLSGRAYVYQGMRVTGAADITEPIHKTLKGKLPQRKISQLAAEGYSAYGNQIGLATGEVKEYYHPGYKAKRLEVGAVVGAAPAKHVQRETPQPSDVIVLIGGPTGRDGCGGATGSSKEHTKQSIKKCGSEVQKGNPVEERKLQRLFRNPKFTQHIKRCNDFGAGGVCVAIGELADGLVINLDEIPVKYKGLDGTELAISESQERMAIVIEAKDLMQVRALCEEENLTAVHVATVTEDKKLKMYWQGREIVNIHRSFLDSAGVKAKKQVKIAEPTIKQETKDFTKENFHALFKDLNCCSQKGLGMQFDSSIGAGSVLLPYGGKNQLTKEVGMVAKIPVQKGETTAGTFMTHGFDPHLAEQSPFHGGMYAVLESIAKLVALGADYTQAYLSFQEYFERLGDEPYKWGKPFAALLGTLVAQDALEVAAIGGKDSMSGTFEELHVPPTLIAFACCVDDVRDVVSGSLKKENHRLVYCHIPRNKDYIPDFTHAKRAYDTIKKQIKKRRVHSSYTVGKGGIAYALLQMSLGNDIGVEVALQPFELQPFEAYYGDIILEVAQEDIDAFDSSYFKIIGTTCKAPQLTIDGVVCDLNEAKTTYEKPLEKVFPVAQNKIERTKDATYNHPPRCYVANKEYQKPTVWLPIFPGTNCEYDMQRVFESAGAVVETLVFKNQHPHHIKASLEQMEKAIEKAQIIALPGGFSAGDEPDGSGKFIAAVLRSDKIKEKIHRHLYVNDGLMIGICNGFQVLVKLGLLPFGEIKEATATSPTLTYNTIGRHRATMATTKITSVQSPWLSKVELGSVHQVPISHGEGRLVAPQEVLDDMMTKGQIFSQYSNIDPNGSMYNIEGIISQDGRILGKMGHSERIGDYIHQNIPGNKNQKLFEAGVAYYK